MMTLHYALASSPIPTAVNRGILTGLLLFCGWGFRATLMEQLPLVLAAVVLHASLAGICRSTRSIENLASL
jgi:hypothetical protein